MLVLVVDDEEEVLEEVTGHIAREMPDIQLIATPLSREARQVLDVELVDVLLTDIRMPGLDGFTLAEAARANGRDTRIVFLTGHYDFEYAFAAIKSGCDDFLLKSQNGTEIVAALKRQMAILEDVRLRRGLLVEAERLRHLARPEAGIDASPVACIKSWIWAHIECDMSLADLARRVYLSPAYLSRLFHEESGSTLSTFITHVRMETARGLLAKTNDKVQDIAVRVGIESAVYFSRLFRRETGMTPQAYRSGIRGGEAGPGVNV